MRYRNIRDKTSGKWVNVLFTTEGSDFVVSELSHRTNIAAGLGQSPNTLETVDGDTDLRTGMLLTLPLTPPLPEEAQRLAIRTAVQTWDSLTTSQRFAAIKPVLSLLGS